MNIILTANAIQFATCCLSNDTVLLSTILSRGGSVKMIGSINTTQQATFSRLAPPRPEPKAFRSSSRCTSLHVQLHKIALQQGRTTSKTMVTVMVMVMARKKETSRKVVQCSAAVILYAPTDRYIKSSVVASLDRLLYCTDDVLLLPECETGEL